MASVSAWSFLKGFDAVIKFIQSVQYMYGSLCFTLYTSTLYTVVVVPGDFAGYTTIFIVQLLEESSELLPNV